MEALSTHHVLGYKQSMFEAQINMPNLTLNLTSSFQILVPFKSVAFQGLFCWENNWKLFCLQISSFWHNIKNCVSPESQFILSFILRDFRITRGHYFTGVCDYTRLVLRKSVGLELRLFSRVPTSWTGNQVGSIQCTLQNSRNVNFRLLTRIGEFHTFPSRQFHLKLWLEKKEFFSFASWIVHFYRRKPIGYQLCKIRSPARQMLTKNCSALSAVLL